VASRSGVTNLYALVTENMQPGVVYTTFHHPESGSNIITTDNSDWATNCPEYKVTAVQINKLMSSDQHSEWQKQFADFTEKQVEFADLDQNG